MKTYSVQEASEILGIPTRTVHYNCKRDKVRKVSNKYQITQKLLDAWTDKKNNQSQHYAQLAKLREEMLLLVEEKKEVETNLLHAEQQIKQHLEHQEEQKNHEQEQSEKYNLLLAENEALKSKLSKKVPHQEQLQKAIELITLEAMKKGVQHKVFTDEEYNDLIGTISEVDFQKEQVQYLRARIEQQDETLMNLSKQLTAGQEIQQQRNYIEAKEKGFDKK